MRNYKKAFRVVLLRIKLELREGAKNAAFVLKR